jgi:hypothetical protein
MQRKCACPAWTDRYECFRLRNQPMDDLARVEWRDNERIEDEGGPCQCDCHYEELEEFDP